MSFETFPQYPPVDGELVDRIVCKLKSQGIFDQFRKDCLADVDTKPAYQNLQQRVNGTVATFLATQAWQQDLNKTQLRESLRRHVQQGFLEVGVDRIVDQVVNPKVFTVFMPKVEDVVYDCLGIEKPKHPPPSNNILASHKLTLVDLLPKDLDPVSPDSDNLSFDEEETKDETNNNESSSKLDVSQDSQVSGISDLSSHMGDSFKENQENNIDSNTLKSVASVNENSNEPHFENFENLSEKIKQAEIGGHNSATSPLPEEQGKAESKVAIEIEQKDIRDDTLMEIDSVSNSTFEEAKTATNKIIKEDTCSRTVSEDSLSCSSFNAKFKKDNSKSVVVGISENSVDKSEVDTPCKELSSDKDIKIPSLNEDADNKSEEKVMENKEARKTDEPKDKKHRESSSSKTSKSSRSSDSKHRSSIDKKDDVKQSKEKTYKEDKDKEKNNKDEKDRSSKHKDDRHHSSKEKYKDKDKNDRNREKESDRKKDKSEHKDSGEKDKKIEKDKYKDKDKNDKEKTRNDKENHKLEKEKSRSEKDKDRHEKEKDKYDTDKHEKYKRDKQKEKREKDKYESKEKDKDVNDKEKEKNEKDKSRDRDKGKSERDYKGEKDKESRPVDEKIRDDKKKDSKKYDKGSSSSSNKKDDHSKNEMKDKSKRSDESAKEKTPNNKSSKNEEEKRDRKRKSERCNDETKLKEARRSWDRDSSGGNGKGHGSQKSTNGDCKVSSSSSSKDKEKRTGESSNQQKTTERKLEQASESEEPSDVDKILMKINSSIEESQNILSDEKAIKKPKIAKNIFEIRKIMQARKNIARQAFMQDKKKKEIMDSVEEVGVSDSTSTTEHPPRGNTKIREENKENIKTGQMDKLKNSKVGLMKGKFNGFLESDIEEARNSLHIFCAHFSNFCSGISMEASSAESVERINFTKMDFNSELLDNNLNKLKAKAVSLERRKTYPDDNHVNKAVENIMRGKNGCYVLLQDCRSHEVIEAIRNSSQPSLNKSLDKHMPSRFQQSSDADGGSIRTNQKKNVKTLESFPKKETFGSAVSQCPEVLNCSVDLGPDIISHTSQQQSKENGNPTKKSATSIPVAKEENSKDEEAFSPVADVTIALNTYLNESKDILPSVPLTEAMLDNLMQQSSILVEDETFTDSDDSMHGYESFKKVEVSEESGFGKEENSLRTSGDGSDLSDEMIMPSDDSRDERGTNRIENEMDSSACDIFNPNKDSHEETKEVKVVKRRNQRLCRSASQRYDSTDLYKPRPVLPQNSKRQRTPRSVSSEDVSTRGLYESNSTPSRKRAR